MEVCHNNNSARVQPYDEKEFNSYDKEAYDWLKKIPPQHWARSHFEGIPLSIQ